MAYEPVVNTPGWLVGLGAVASILYWSFAGRREKQQAKRDAELAIQQNTLALTSIDGF